jgi:hypothetical protein
MKNINKKGQWSVWGKIIIVLLILIISILLYNKFIKGSTKILLCNKNGGDCETGTCDFLTQFPALGDKAAGCKTDEICCVNITQEEKIDPYCKDLKVGDPCRTDEGNMYYCGPGKVCMTLCRYCSIVWGDSTLNKPCGAQNLKIFAGNNNPTNTDKFSCSCDATACSQAMIDAGKCIKQFCPSTNPEFYCCRNELAVNNAKTTTPASTNNVPGTNTGGDPNYDFKITDAWFDNSNGNLPTNCHLGTNSAGGADYYTMICTPNNAYSIPVFIEITNLHNAIVAYADPYAAINGVGNTIKGLGTYLGKTSVSIGAQSVGTVQTNIVISQSESIDGNMWWIYPGAICTTTACINTDASKIGVTRTDTTHVITIKFQSTTT